MQHAASKVGVLVRAARKVGVLVRYLEKEQLTALLGAIPKDGERGRRDYALLLFMARHRCAVQEVDT